MKTPPVSGFLGLGGGKDYLWFDMVIVGQKGPETIVVSYYWRGEPVFKQEIRGNLAAGQELTLLGFEGCMEGKRIPA